METMEMEKKVKMDASKNLVKAVINQGKRLGGEVISSIKGRSGRDFLEWLEWSLERQILEIQEALKTGKDDNIGIKERDKIKANISINIARVYSASQVDVNLNTADGGITWDASLVDYTK